MLTKAVLALPLLAVLTRATEQQVALSIDGGWSPWSTIPTPCLRENAQGEKVEVTCGGGTQMKIRSCTNPRPQVSCRREG